MIDSKNTLKSPYSHYETRLIKKYISQIPKERREEVLVGIQAQAFFFGCKNEKALKTALKTLHPTQINIKNPEKLDNHHPM